MPFARVVSWLYLSPSSGIHSWMHHLASSSALISQCLQPCAVAILFIFFSHSPLKSCISFNPASSLPITIVHFCIDFPPLFSVHLSIYGSPSMPSCMWRMHFFFLKMEKNYNWSQLVFVIVCSFPSLTGIGGKNGFLGLGCVLGKERSVVSAQRTSYDIFLFFGKECVEWTSVCRKNERVVQVWQQCRASQLRRGMCAKRSSVPLQRKRRGKPWNCDASTRRKKRHLTVVRARKPVFTLSV